MIEVVVDVLDCVCMAGRSQGTAEDAISLLEVWISEGKVLVSRGTQTEAKVLVGSSSSSYITASLARTRLGTQPREEPGTKVLSHAAILYWLQGGGARRVRKERELVRRTHLGYNTVRGFVSHKAFVLYSDDFVVRNENTRGEAKRFEPEVDRTTLPLFSLAFTEHTRGAIEYTTVWQLEEQGWLERASAARVAGSEDILDIEVPVTPYGPGVKGTKSALW